MLGPAVSPPGGRRDPRACRRRRCCNHQHRKCHRRPREVRGNHDRIRPRRSGDRDTTRRPNHAPGEVVGFQTLLALQRGQWRCREWGVYGNGAGKHERRRQEKGSSSCRQDCQWGSEKWHPKSESGECWWDQRRRITALTNQIRASWNCSRGRGAGDDGQRAQRWRDAVRCREHVEAANDVGNDRDDQ